MLKILRQNFANPSELRNFIEIFNTCIYVFIYNFSHDWTWICRWIGFSFHDDDDDDDDDDNDDDENDDNENDDEDDGDDDESNNEEDVEDAEEESRETSNEEYLDFVHEADNFVRKKD